MACGIAFSRNDSNPVSLNADTDACYKEIKQIKQINIDEKNMIDICK